MASSMPGIAFASSENKLSIPSLPPISSFSTLGSTSWKSPLPKQCHNYILKNNIINQYNNSPIQLTKRTQDQPLQRKKEQNFIKLYTDVSHSKLNFWILQKPTIKNLKRTKFTTGYSQIQLKKIQNSLEIQQTHKPKTKKDPNFYHGI